MNDWLTTDATVRVYTQVLRRARPRAALVAFHGYAENPDRILAALDRPSLAEVELVAPMGMHHFYNRTGDVVASWMTRFRREDQIQQFLAAQREIVRRVVSPDQPAFVLGYSQGAAAAYRLGVLGGLPLRRIFCLAGDMPPEVRTALTSQAPIPVDLFLGEQDERVPLATLQRDADALRSAGWQVTLHRGPGGHEIAPKMVDRVAQIIGQQLD